MTLTQSRLKEVLHYDPETGVFVWRVSRGPKALAGQRAGYLRDDGYWEIQVQRKKHMAHRLAWLYSSGELPTNDIDHINGDTNDNRLANLRDVLHVVNQQNRRAAFRNNMVSGYLGVHQHRRRWAASISINNVKQHLGTYDTALEAHEAYLSAKRLLHAGCTI